MTARTRRRRLVLACLATLALAGCGTTVSGSDATSAGGPGAINGLSVTTGGAGSRPGSASTSTGTTGGYVGGTTTGVIGTSGTGGIPGTTGGGTTTGGTTGTTGASNVPLAQSPGVTATKIYIGLVYAKNTSSVLISNATLGDMQADGNAVIDDINKHGGIAGRKLVPVWRPFDSASTQPADNQYEGICQYFTHDRPVYAVEGAGTPSYQDCIAKAGIVQLSSDLPSSDAEVFRTHPAFIELGYPNLDRLATEQVRALSAQNYFSGWNTTLARPAKTKAKVGVITYDSGPFKDAVNSILIPGLRSLGYPPRVAYVGEVDKASDYGSQAAAIQSAELNFASNGVTHVIMFEGNGGISLFFLQQSQSQQYYPRLGVNSTSALQVLMSGDEVREQQAQGAIGFGWLPSFDLTPNRNPDNGPYSNDARRHCLAVMKSHGITFSDSNAEGVAMEYCSTFYLLQRTVNGIHGAINATSFVRNVNTLGASYQAAGGLGTFLSPTQHDGESKIYYWRYYNDCKCMHYTGPRRTIP